MQDKRVHGGATLGVMVQDSKPSKPDNAITAEDMVVDILKIDSRGGNRSGWEHFGLQQGSVQLGRDQSSVPEGRVHGGSLIAMLAGGSSRSENMIGGPSEMCKFYMMPQNWR